MKRKLFQWLCAGLLLTGLASCNLPFNGNNDKDDELKQTQEALDEQREALSLTKEARFQATMTAAQFTIDAQSAPAASETPAPDLAATQVALAVEQTLAASGGAGGTPPTQGPPPSATVAGSGGASQNVPTSTTAPSPTVSGFTALPGISTYTDNFIDPNSGWPVNLGGADQWWYNGGFYYITVGSLNTQVVVTPGRSYANTWVQTSAIVTQDVPWGSFGVVCRYQDANNYYFFQIGLDGDYKIGKIWNGQYYLIGMGKPKYSAAIQGGNNTIQATCYGNNELSLTINDIFIETVYDNTFQSGQVGLIASVTDFVPFTVAFDYVFADE